MNNAYYFNDELKRLREEKRWTQQEVADAVKRDRQTIYCAEAGRRISYELLYDLATLFKVDVTGLLKRNPVPQNK